MVQLSNGFLLSVTILHLTSKSVYVFPRGQCLASLGFVSLKVDALELTDFRIDYQMSGLEFRPCGLRVKSSGFNVHSSGLKVYQNNMSSKVIVLWLEECTV